MEYTREEATAKLMAELEKGRASGEGEGWLSLEKVMEHFKIRDFSNETEVIEPK